MKNKPRDIDPFVVADALEAGKITRLLECYTPPTATRQTASTISSSPTVPCRPLGTEREGRGQALQRRHRARPSGITEKSLCVCFQQT